MTIAEALAGQNVSLMLTNLYADPKWKEFVECVRVGLGLNPDDSKSVIKANSVERICLSAGYTTVEQLDVAITSNTLNTFALMARKPMVKSVTKVSHDYLRGTIQNTIGFIADVDIDWFQNDADYTLLTKADLDDILLFIANKSPLYVATTYDCDDYQKEVLGWLAKVGLGNVSIGAMNTRSYTYDGKVLGHAGLVVVYDNQAMFLEPQTGQLLPIGDKRIGSYLLTKEVKVVDCGF